MSSFVENASFESQILIRCLICYLLYAVFEKAHLWMWWCMLEMWFSKGKFVDVTFHVVPHFLDGCFIVSLSSSMKFWHRVKLTHICFVHCFMSSFNAYLYAVLKGKFVNIDIYFEMHIKRKMCLNVIVYVLSHCAQICLICA